jgi:hypothetical protein
MKAFHGTSERIRELIAESANMARIQAELVETYNAIGDDTGLIYAARRHTAYTKTLLNAIRDLREAKATEGAR